MRVAGWSFIVLGTAIVVLFVVVALTQGELRWGALPLGVITAFVGLRMRSLASGLVETPGRAGSLVQQTGPTIELPLSPREASVIRATPRKILRKTVIVLSIFLAILLGYAMIIGRFKSASPWVGLLITGLVGGLLILMVVGAFIFATWLPARRDLREATYLRTSGPVAIVKMKNGYLLRLADRSFTVTSDVGETIANHSMDWAVVDHSRHAHIVLGVWDLSGKNVFSGQGYQADPPNIARPNLTPH
jgi:hypothetical protein